MTMSYCIAGHCMPMESAIILLDAGILGCLLAVAVIALVILGEDP